MKLTKVNREQLIMLGCLLIGFGAGLTFHGLGL